jgi:L-lactate utilization protein LutC
VVRVPASGAAAAVGRALARTGAWSLVVPSGLPEDLVPDGPWSLLADVPPLTVGQLDAADAVITTVAAAIAVTGTVALDHGPGQGRRTLTLLPDEHICLVQADQQ